MVWMTCPVIVLMTEMVPLKRLEPPVRARVRRPGRSWTHEAGEPQEIAADGSDLERAALQPQPPGTRRVGVVAADPGQSRRSTPKDTSRRPPGEANTLPPTAHMYGGAASTAAVTEPTGAPCRRAGRRRPNTRRRAAIRAASACRTSRMSGG